MNDDAFNMSMRKFLKRLGVTGQQAIEEAVRKARDDGQLQGDEALEVRATISIGQVGLNHAVDGEIRLGSETP